MAIKKEKNIELIEREEEVSEDQLVHPSDDLPKTFPIIAIGGSAGSFHAFEKFFLHMPSNSGMAFIIIMHLERSTNVSVSSLLQQTTSMNIIEATDGMTVEPDHVYVIPPNRDMGIHKGQLLLFNASRSKGAHMSIDYFLQSLSEDQWNHAVAIVFSGMGADGETGVRMIKEKLGMVMVQDPETAEYSSMPSASIKTNMVDYILAPEEMPAKLIQYLNHPALREPIADEFVSERNNQTHVQKILMLLRSSTGHDFSLYKKNTIIRRIERRIAFHQLPDYVHYVNYMRENPHEIEMLFNELLIGVTKFFRDSSAFEILKIRLDKLLLSKLEDEPIRVWIAGCSTGEEAYSVAIIIMEYLNTLDVKHRPKAQIFATDLDSNAIEHARTGFYFANIVSEVSPERIEQFFVKKNNGYQVKKEVREMIIFAQHNLIKDAPFTRLDLLCCRNVMIYLTTDLQRKILPVFHYSLNAGAILFLGPAESVSGFNDIFNVIDSKWKMYERKQGASALGKMLDFPFHISHQPNKNIKADPLSKPSDRNPVAETFNKVLLDNYTPPSLLLNEKGEILYINGKTGKYIQLISGEAIMNIHRMAREELKYALGNAIHQAWSQKTRVEISGIKIKENQKVHIIDFSVDYLVELPLQGLLLVTFYDKGVLKKSKASLRQLNDPSRDGAIEELEKELIYTKQQLHTTIEQMETSLEELKSTNEELQSTNEELQSTNEEALTTKEEMQSLNEELMTINLQYQNKAEELTQLNNDMKNLLDNTEIGTIFMDNQLNILRFTPQVTKLFNVIPSDVGRSITHIVSNFDYPSIENAILEVIEKLVGKEIEVKTKKGDWYNLRIMPYRTLDNFINGAVLTFTKITPVKAMEIKLGNLLNYAQFTVDNFPQSALVLDPDKKILSVNKKFLKMFNLLTSDVQDQSFMELLHNRWKTNKLDHFILKQKEESRDTFIQLAVQGAEVLNLLIQFKTITSKEGEDNLLSIITFNSQGFGEKN
jgi:two-component system CheB/CheR fusion protein